MEGVTVDQVDTVVEQSYFEKESSGKTSWNFVTKRHCRGPKFVPCLFRCLPFVQMFVIFILKTLCIVKLATFKPTCEETSVWISILSI